ncbi:hypothetical protein P154DRAFT_124579 [Amniculicola lignicola CBS 123094]|uniref:Uncharacterized protein n=1 Tax=Amniculicola lignicola CBS 123094 TaxID=1392246 RepID=A0A6A5WMC2_9PLEO|nr:hypothetical protein P154DRAFT_124579 [Amniculicola lignicola CBS 123094]
MESLPSGQDGRQGEDGQSASAPIRYQQKFKYGSRILSQRCNFTCADVINSKPTHQRLILYFGIVFESISVYTVASLAAVSFASLITTKRVTSRSLAAAAGFGAAISILLALPPILCALFGFKWRRLYGEVARLSAFSASIALASFIAFGTIPWQLEAATALFIYPLNVNAVMERPVTMGAKHLFKSKHDTNDYRPGDRGIYLNRITRFTWFIYTGVNNALFVLFVKWLGFDICPPLAAAIAACVYTVVSFPFRQCTSLLLARTWETGTYKEIPIHFLRRGDPPLDTDLFQMYKDTVQEAKQHLSTPTTDDGYGTIYTSSSQTLPPSGGNPA